MRSELVLELDRATEEAELAPMPEASSAMLHVYAEEGDWRG
jgi:hypothetical protein